MTAEIAPEQALDTVLVGLRTAHRRNAAALGLPVNPFIGDVLGAEAGLTRVRDRVTGAVHSLPPVYVLTPVIPLSGPMREVSS